MVVVRTRAKMIAMARTIPMKTRRFRRPTQQPLGSSPSRVLKAFFFRESPYSVFAI